MSTKAHMIAEGLQTPYTAGAVYPKQLVELILRCDNTIFAFMAWRGIEKETIIELVGIEEYFIIELDGILRKKTLFTLAELFNCTCTHLIDGCNKIL